MSEVRGWDLSPKMEVIIKVPEKVIKLFRWLDSKLDTEWVVFLKVDRIEENVVYLSEEFFVPEQEVMTSHAEPKEVPPKGFNVAVHKHPNGITSFSSTDYKNICANSFISLLWVNNDIKDATVKLKLGDTDILIGKEYIKVYVVEEIADFGKEILEKIKKKTFTYPNTLHSLSKENSINPLTLKDCYEDYYGWLYAQSDRDALDLDADYEERLAEAIYEFLEKAGDPDFVHFSTVRRWMDAHGYGDLKDEDLKEMLMYYGVRVV